MAQPIATGDAPPARTSDGAHGGSPWRRLRRALRPRRERAGRDLIDEMDVAEARQCVRLACVVVLAVLVAGLLAIPAAGSVAYTAYSLFFYQFSKIEGPALALVGLFLLVLVALIRRAPSGSLAVPQWRYRWWIVALLGAAVTAGALLGIRYVFRGYLLADDEYSAWFQAIIFAHGQRTVAIPRGWCQYVAAITPSSIYASPNTCTWRLSYLPLHSLVQAPFIALGVGRLGVPLVSGLSVVLVASIARKLWPERPSRAYVAALFMATSTQVLFMSMTMFSMPTHLFFSLLWLWLYVDDRRWANVLLPWMGVLAIGVHSPLPHLFFAAIFVARYLWDRRFLLLSYVGAVYFAGLMFWYGYLQSAKSESVTTVASAGATAEVAKGLLHLPSQAQFLTTALHLALLPSWSAPIAIVAAVVAMLAWSRLDAFSRTAALSVVFILVARMLVSPSQGEGWGYRFAYDGLASLALLSGVGVDILTRALGARRTGALLGASTALMLAVQVPLRATDVNLIIGDYRSLFTWMTHLPYDAVFLPTEKVPWGRQLVQNDPYLRHAPVIVDWAALTGPQFDALTHDPRVRVKQITDAELASHGFRTESVALDRLQKVR